MGLRIMQSRAGMIGRHAGHRTQRRRRRQRDLLGSQPDGCRQNQNHHARKTNRRKRVLIVDDHPMMRTGLAQLIDNEPDLKVCAEADNAGQALQMVGKQNFDLILLDISLPDKNGVELIKDILAQKPGLPILVVSMHDELLYAERVLRAGARGYIMKQEGGKKLLHAIRQVLGGQIYVSEKMSARILEVFSGQRAATAADSPSNAFPTANLRCSN